MFEEGQTTCSAKGKERKNYTILRIIMVISDVKRCDFKED
jgi:hypothetical protein